MADNTIAVLAIIYFMVISPGFRATAIIILGILGIGIYVMVENSNKKDEEWRQRQAAQERRVTTAIGASDLSLTDVALGKEYGGWVLTGTVTNNAKSDSIRSASS